MSISFALVRGVDAGIRRSIRHQDTVQLIVLVRKEFGSQPPMRSVVEAPGDGWRGRSARAYAASEKNRPVRMRRRAPGGCPAAGDHQRPSRRHPYEVAIDDACW